MKLRSLSLACALSGALLLSAATASAQAFEGSVSYRLMAQGQSIDMTQYVKGTNIRIELGLSGQEFTLLTDGEGTKQIMLMPETRQWIDLKAMQERMAAMMGGMPGRGAMGGGAQAPAEPGSFSIEATGRMETVAGLTCEHYLVTMDGEEVDVCATTGLGWHVGVPPALGNLAGMAGGMGRGAGGMMGGMMGGAARSQDLPSLSPAQMRELEARFSQGFFPLKISFSRDGTEGSLEVTAVERTSVEDALFSPPAGYQEMRIPGR